MTQILRWLAACIVLSLLWACEPIDAGCDVGERKRGLELAKALERYDGWLVSRGINQLTTIGDRFEVDTSVLQRHALVLQEWSVLLRSIVRRYNACLISKPELDEALDDILPAMQRTARELERISSESWAGEAVDEEDVGAIVASLTPQIARIAEIADRAYMIDEAAAQVLAVRADEDLTNEAFRQAFIGHVPSELPEYFVANNAGAEALNAGDHDEALRQAELAVRIAEENLGPYHYYLGFAYANLGETYRGIAREDSARLAEAEGYFKRAVDVHRAVLGDYHMEVSIVVNSAGHVLQQQHKCGEALPYFLEAIDIMDRAFGSSYVNIPIVATNAVYCYEELGDYEAAEDFARRALEIGEQRFGGDDVRTGDFSRNLARILLARDRPADAEDLALRAVNIYTATRGNYDSSTLGGLKLLREIRASHPVDLSSLTGADSVVVDDGERTHIMGAIAYGLGEQGAFTGRAASPMPAGPRTVYIYRTISPNYAERLADRSIEGESDSAYLLPEGLGYGIAALQQMRFVRAIDPSLSDEELAAEFGLVSE